MVGRILTQVKEKIGEKAYKYGFIPASNGLLLVLVAAVGNHDSSIFWWVLAWQFVHGFVAALILVNLGAAAAQFLVENRDFTPVRASIAAGAFLGWASWSVVLYINYTGGGSWWWLLPAIVFVTAPYLTAIGIRPLVNDKA